MVGKWPSVLALVVLATASNALFESGAKHNGHGHHGLARRAGDTSSMQPYTSAKLVNPSDEGVGSCKSSVKGTLKGMGEVDSKCKVQWSDQAKELRGSYGSQNTYSNLHGKWVACPVKTLHSESIDVKGSKLDTMAMVDHCGAVTVTVELPVDLHCSKQGQKWTCTGQMPGISCENHGPPGQPDRPTLEQPPPAGHNTMSPPPTTETPLPTKEKDQGPTPPGNMPPAGDRHGSPPPTTETPPPTNEKDHGYPWKETTPPGDDTTDHPNNDVTPPGGHKQDSMPPPTKEGHGYPWKETPTPGDDKEASPPPTTEMPPHKETPTTNTTEPCPPGQETGGPPPDVQTDLKSPPPVNTGTTPPGQTETPPPNVQTDVNTPPSSNKTDSTPTPPIDNNLPPTPETVLPPPTLQKDMSPPANKTDVPCEDDKLNKQTDSNVTTTGMPNKQTDSNVTPNKQTDSKQTPSDMPPNKQTDSNVTTTGTPNKQTDSNVTPNKQTDSNVTPNKQTDSNVTTNGMPNQQKDSKLTQSDADKTTEQLEQESIGGEGIAPELNEDQGTDDMPKQTDSNTTATTDTQKDAKKPSTEGQVDSKKTNETATPPIKDGQTPGATTDTQKDAKKPSTEGQVDSKKTNETATPPIKNGQKDSQTPVDLTPVTKEAQKVTPESTKQTDSHQGPNKGPDSVDQKVKNDTYGRKRAIEGEKASVFASINKRFLKKRM